MSEQVQPVTPMGPEGVSEVAAPSAGTIAASSSTAANEAGKAEGSNYISNMSELKTKAPKVYKAMMEGVAETIIGDMREHQARLKELIREGERNS